ncbi:MAG: hypothetical protein KGL39_01165 [Patescibacteria group bacterium]|nr:hypothetical protein [Patescibacteria group bacterium]
MPKNAITMASGTAVAAHDTTSLRWPRGTSSGADAKDREGATRPREDAQKHHEDGRKRQEVNARIRVEAGGSSFPRQRTLTATISLILNVVRQQDTRQVYGRDELKTVQFDREIYPVTVPVLRPERG